MEERRKEWMGEASQPYNGVARLDPDLLRAWVPESAVVGRQVLVFEETDSTNDLAARAGEDGLAEGLVIFAESQRAGRGTSGRRWVSPPRQNLLFSVLLRPVDLPAARWPELTFCAALAVAEAAERLTGQAARIKWPNDVLLAGRKVAGILLETYRRDRAGFVVIGIGLNVLQRAEDFDPAIRARAGSLAMIAAAARVDAAPPKREEAAAAVLTRLGELYDRWRGGFAGIMAECERRGCPEAGGRGGAAS